MSSPNRDLLIAITLAKIDLPCSLGSKASRLWTPSARPEHTKHLGSGHPLPAQPFKLEINSRANDGVELSP
jgi:hypothetical protein